jgi:hypothetical protein
MSGKPTPRFTVTNLDQWGRLVKSWAADLDYISQPYELQPPRDYWVNDSWPGTKGSRPAPETVPAGTPGDPRAWCLPPSNVALNEQAGGTVPSQYAAVLTVEEFKKRLDAAGVIYTLPDKYTHVFIVQGKETTMFLRLPPKDTLQSSEDDLLNGPPYALPPFYAALYNSFPTPPTDQAGIMQLHADRIGEYTLNTCN